MFLIIFFCVSGLFSDEETVLLLGFSPLMPNVVAQGVNKVADNMLAINLVANCFLPIKNASQKFYS